MLVGLIVLAIAGAARTEVALLWCLGCTITGFVAGFLFGFPRVVTEGGQTPALSSRDETTSGMDPANSSGSGKQSVAKPFAHRLAVNTNLEQISDWLTKIIIGIGLVEHKNLPMYFGHAGEYIGQGFGGTVNAAGTAVAATTDVSQFNARLATVILVFFSSLGVLSGYLLTRTFFSAAFRRADEHSAGPLSAEAKKIAETPLETEGRKIELPDATKSVSRGLVRAPQPESSASADDQAAWARVQFDVGHYKEAVDGYRQAVLLKPKDARLRHSYGIALKFAGRAPTIYMEELERAVQLARAETDLQLRRDIYASFTYNALYLPEPEGFQRARRAATEYVGTPESLPSGQVWINIACVCGQEYSYEKKRGSDDKALAALRDKALQALRETLKAEPSLLRRIQELLQGQPPGDDDILPF